MQVPYKKGEYTCTKKYRTSYKPCIFHQQKKQKEKHSRKDYGNINIAVYPFFMISQNRSMHLYPPKFS